MKKLSDDERIKSETNKIYATAFKILLIGNIFSVIYRLVLKKESFLDVFDMNIVILVTCIYIIINFIHKGIFNMKLGNSKLDKFYVFGTSLISSIIFTLAMNFNENIDLKKIIIMWILFVTIIYIILTIFTKISSKKN